ncbi:HesB/IscA family protein [Methylocaldum szegediense]|jgi:iron-sulfur cluster assembly protein|uniref:Iron-sulfur cluster insertion protein IscA n=1 Tax=Methylocaldum szegediense TaxID=73780 RepID=A0ABN8XCV4_9GAMM|nr:iron-sulfur cluster assembly accessory protein [Methylocaldum szegediense]CAI8946594.1 iron-sulfur cluster insertion protein IscA [Methylocaldum szegediense]
MSITLTEKAAEQIAKQLQKRGKGVGLRLGVKKSGCTGFAYVVEYADAVEPDDSVFEQHGVKVVVRNNDLAYLSGVRVDYRREGINEAFRFDNPNVKATCGCGESFAV